MLVFVTYVSFNPLVSKKYITINGTQKEINLSKLLFSVLITLMDIIVGGKDSFAVFL